MDSAHPYTDGLAQGVVRYQQCTGCGTAQTLARLACCRCGGLQLAWRDACGFGTVHAVTVVERAPSEAFRALVPYTLLLVTLDEGARVMAHGEPGLAIGERVRARPWQAAGLALLRFQRSAAT